MNYRAVLMMIKTTWQTWLEQRTFFFMLAFLGMLGPLIYLFVWTTAAGAGEVGGLTSDEFVVYYLVFMVVNQLTSAMTYWTVGAHILSGTYSRLLLYPLAPVYDALANELAGKAVFLLFVVPATVGLGLYFQPEIDITGENLLLFVPAVLLAWGLRFLWGYWIALLAFWTERGDRLLGLQEALTFVFAGQVAPIALLPALLQDAAVILPFRYMISFPIEVLMGQLTGGEVVSGFGLLAGWLVVSYVLYRVVLSRGLRRYTAIGG